MSPDSLTPLIPNSLRRDFDINITKAENGFVIRAYHTDKRFIAENISTLSLIIEDLVKEN